jgi:hypothetical protein
MLLLCTGILFARESTRKVLQDADLLSATLWGGDGLPGVWKPVEGGHPGVHALEDPPMLFGQQAKRVVVTWGEDGKIAQVSVLYAEGTATSDDDYTRLRSELKKVLLEKCGPVRGVKTLIGAEPTGYEFQPETARVRMTAEPGVQVAVTMIPPRGKGGNAGDDGVIFAKPPEPPSNPLLHPAAAGVKRLPNGDVILGNQPELDETLPMAYPGMRSPGSVIPALNYWPLAKPRNPSAFA